MPQNEELNQNLFEETPEKNDGGLGYAQMTSNLGTAFGSEQPAPVTSENFYAQPQNRVGPQMTNNELFSGRIGNLSNPEPVATPPRQPEMDMDGYLAGIGRNYNQPPQQAPINPQTPGYIGEKQGFFGRLGQNIKSIPARIRRGLGNLNSRLHGYTTPRDEMELSDLQGINLGMNKETEYGRILRAIAEREGRGDAQSLEDYANTTPIKFREAMMDSMAEILNAPGMFSPQQVNQARRYYDAFDRSTYKAGRNGSRDYGQYVPADIRGSMGGDSAANVDPNDSMTQYRMLEGGLRDMRIAGGHNLKDSMYQPREMLQTMNNIRRESGFAPLPDSYIEGIKDTSDLRDYEVPDIQGERPVPRWVINQGPIGRREKADYFGGQNPRRLPPEQERWMAERARERRENIRGLSSQDFNDRINSLQDFRDYGNRRRQILETQDELNRLNLNPNGPVAAGRVNPELKKAIKANLRTKFKSPPIPELRRSANADLIARNQREAARLSGAPAAPPQVRAPHKHYTLEERLAEEKKRSEDFLNAPISSHQQIMSAYYNKGENIRGAIPRRKRAFPPRRGTQIAPTSEGYDPNIDAQWPVQSPSPAQYSMPRMIVEGNENDPRYFTNPTPEQLKYKQPKLRADFLDDDDYYYPEYDPMENARKRANIPYRKISMENFYDLKPIRRITNAPR